MLENDLRSALNSLLNKELMIEDFIEKFKGISTLSFAEIDIDRQERTGQPECVYGENKTSGQIIATLQKLQQNNQTSLATKVSVKKAKKVLTSMKEFQYSESGKCLWWRAEEGYKTIGEVAIICAGTSDLPVAEECAITLQCMGHSPARYTDIGVAGIHRLLQKLSDIRKHKLLIVIAGMEGALASVLAGLVKAPIIAVPTSVGYGSHLNGLVPLLSMLNSCAAGLTVVNIDNGFGAATAAARILEKE